jgi:hypothetical protein
MRKLSFIAVTLLTTTLFSCKKTSTASISGLSNLTINGATYNTSHPSFSILTSFWSDSLNMIPISLQVLGGNTAYDSATANKSIVPYTYDGGSFCLAIAFRERPTANKTYSICSTIPYSTNYGSDIANTNVTDSTCTIVGSLFSDLSGDYWFSNNPNNKVVVTINGGKITATFSNISLVYNAVYGNGNTYYTTVSGTLIEDK